MQRFGGQLGNNGEPHGNMMGTREKRKILLLLILSRKEKIGPVMSPC
jgi:hypothetical protein